MSPTAWPARTPCGFVSSRPRTVRHGGIPWEPAVGIAVSTEDNQATAYFDYTRLALGVAVGFSAGLEMGFWMQPIRTFKGRYWGVEVEAAWGPGGGVGFYWSNEEENKGEFLGFQLVGTGGTEIDLRLVIDGQTYTFGEEGAKKFLEMARQVPFP